VVYSRQVDGTFITKENGARIGDMTSCGLQKNVLGKNERGVGLIIASFDEISRDLS
jgi:hypothetical protein